MPALIPELISKRDNFEIIRDQIAGILAVELAHQKQLSGEEQPKVFIERANPWGQFIEAERFMPPVINVWFDSATFDESSSNVIERQKCEAVFNIDCYGAGVNVDDGMVAGGHHPADLQAALEAQRAVRLARNILMAGAYTYLGLRGLVWRRFPQTISMFQPQIDQKTAQRIVGARLALQVHFNEFSPQVEGQPIETIKLDVLRSETGQLLLSAEYVTPTP